MTISYDLEKIKKIIDDLHLITNLSLGFMNVDFNFLYRRVNENDVYCEKITSTPEGLKRCLCSDVDLVRRCKECMKPISHVCHAGVIDTTVPIIKQGVVSGYIIIGRIRQRNSAGIRERIEWLGDMRDNILGEYKRLSYFSEEQLESLIDIISNIIFENAISLNHDNVAAAARDYIEKHISEDLSIKRLCTALFVSKNRLYDSFRESLGVTVNEYVTEARINYAKKLLSETDMTVSEVAEAVGIGNTPYFCELFKKRVGATPRKSKSLSRKST